MTYNITEICRNLVLASAQLEVLRAQAKDYGDDEQAKIFTDLINAVTEASEFLSDLEDCDDDDFDD